MEALINLCKNLLSNVDNAISIVLLRPEIQKYIVELNQDQLQQHQVDSENVLLPFYSPYSLKLKQQKFGGDYPKRFTLQDTGEFYDSFKLYLKSDYFMITGNTKKPNKDLLEYSQNILGLTDESMGLLIEKINPLVIQQLLK